jgi:predicted RNase H-like HicB family nuclease
VSTQTLRAVVQKEGDGWVSWCPELDVASQGDTVEQAKANLKEAVDLFLETASPQEIQKRLRTETYLSSLEVRLG